MIVAYDLPVCNVQLYEQGNIKSNLHCNKQCKLKVLSKTKPKVTKKRLPTLSLLPDDGVVLFFNNLNSKKQTTFN